MNLKKFFKKNLDYIRKVISFEFLITKMTFLTNCKEGHVIWYDEKKDEIIYKENNVSYSILYRAYKSTVDRSSITDKLIMTKKSGFVNLGCLMLSNGQCEEIIKKVSEIKKIS